MSYFVTAVWTDFQSNDTGPSEIHGPFPSFEEREAFLKAELAGDDESGFLLTLFKQDENGEMVLDDKRVLYDEDPEPVGEDDDDDDWDDEEE